MAHGTRVTFSPKVFIPLTMLCRDRCGYCTFAKAPARLAAPYLTPDEVLALAAVSQADLIITGDADLLTLGSHAGIPIIDPAEALTRISG